jgi:hypothetical protein
MDEVKTVVFLILAAAVAGGLLALIGVLMSHI